MREYFSGREQQKEKIAHPLELCAEQNVNTICALCNNSSDIQTRFIKSGGRGFAVIHLEGLVDKYDLSMTIVNPLLNAKISPDDSAQAVFDRLLGGVFNSVDIKTEQTAERCAQLLMSGFAVLFMDGVKSAIVVGVQGYEHRNIDEPTNEISLYGSRESFCENMRVNMAMVRRRFKSTELVFEYMSVGKSTNTDICLCYIKNSSNKTIINKTRAALENTDIQTVLGAEYIRPFLEDNPFSVFDTVGITERPDVLCGKLGEGRVAVMVDGSPGVLYAPCLFTENFQTSDDYVEKPIFAAFSRWLRYFSFLISLYLPALYVAIGIMHTELLPVQLLARLADAEAGTPFNIMGEVFVMHIIFELIREAVLRMPRQISGSISFIATLLIGESAVNAGLISLPAIVLVAVTGICSFTAPSLYQLTALLRLGLILVGGVTGVMGISVVSAMLLVNMCSLGYKGVPFTAPFSPFRLKSMRDIAMRAGWRVLGKKSIKIGDMPGSDYNR